MTAPRTCPKCGSCAHAVTYLAGSTNRVLAELKKATEKDPRKDPVMLMSDDQAEPIARPHDVAHLARIEQELLEERRQHAVTQARLETSPLYTRNQELTRECRAAKDLREEALKMAHERHQEVKRLRREALDLTSENHALRDEVNTLARLLHTKRSVRAAKMFLGAAVRLLDIATRGRSEYP